ncbi:retropepsin-like aspartic protease family protein [Maritalea mediterranea]|uniref:TIGR02281 family clan AA aspartic protease n=1 Tax=Maritalea mediterranea TaxID=2909667 RepID=A0ABS9E750_9HYPH|nr:TIGR02281 family clan AA aspartic protease [Maritalea mediterranea]MCF4098017.1 TIGR02281 family clan AA aspartic protease [Maritalea mediterranea]
MFFIGIALLVAFALAFLISSNAGQLIGLAEQDFGQLVVLIAVLVLVAGGAFGRRIRLGEMLSGIVMWVAIFAAIIIGYSFRADFESFGARLWAQLSPGAGYTDTESGTVMFSRNANEHFVINAKINGTEQQFLFDTGASAIVLTADSARAAGYDPTRLIYSIPVQTANGQTEAALVKLDRIEVGGIVRENIDAMVARPEALKSNLLGMNYLQTLRGFSVEGDRLTFTD